MRKRKAFGVSQALERGLSETISIVENDAGIFRNAVIPTSRIETDPDNPRQLLIDVSEISTGPAKDDPDYSQKHAEYQKLCELADTIKSRGLLQPIAVYKHSDKYRVVAGNRRFLAAIIADKTEIEARVFQKELTPFDLKLVQWIENTAREDLTLYERIGNIKGIVRAYQKDHQLGKVTATVLSQITGLSKTQSIGYLSIMNAPEDVQHAVREGTIRNLDKAAIIAAQKNPECRANAIKACQTDISMASLKGLLKTHANTTSASQLKRRSTSRGRRMSRVNMGTTTNARVVETIVKTMLTLPHYKQHASNFYDVDWQHFEAATGAFKRFIRILDNTLNEGK